MDVNKDYYAILGVHPSTEDIVIKAAYKALAQRYHPDCYKGPAAEAHAKMVLINDAYSVLSNNDTRAEYDRQRGSNTQSAESAFEQDDDYTNNSLYNKDWEVALEYFEDLKKIEERLKKLSWKVALSYRCFMLETKEFVHRHKYARDLEEGYLRTYFGKKKEIVDFAKDLIYSNNRSAALELNKVVRVLGDSIDQKTVIAKIKDKFKLNKPNNSSDNDIDKKFISVKYKPNNLVVVINGIRVFDNKIKKTVLNKVNEVKVYNDYAERVLHEFSYIHDLYDEEEISFDFTGHV